MVLKPKQYMIQKPRQRPVTRWFAQSRGFLLEEAGHGGRLGRVVQAVVDIFKFQQLSHGPNAVPLLLRENERQLGMRIHGIQLNTVAAFKKSSPQRCGTMSNLQGGFSEHGQCETLTILFMIADITRILAFIIIVSKTVRLSLSTWLLVLDYSLCIAISEEFKRC